MGPISSMAQERTWFLNCLVLDHFLYEEQTAGGQTGQVTKRIENIPTWDKKGQIFLAWQKGVLVLSVLVGIWNGLLAPQALQGFFGANVVGKLGVQFPREGHADSQVKNRA